MTLIDQRRCYGRDQNGKLVLNGSILFRLVDQSGLPLEFALAELDQRGIVPDWIGFIICAALAGWNPGTIRARIVEAIRAVYRRDDLEPRLDQVMDWLRLKGN